MISKMREPVNGLTHLFGAIAGLFGLLFLLFSSRLNTLGFISILIYGVSLVLLFSASAAYHLATVRSEIILILRKLDHSAIYILIAGTYTPFCINAFEGFFQWGLLLIVWGVAIIGIMVKIFYINSPRWFSAGVYVILGWVCMAAIGQMITNLSSWSLIWLAGGGVIYTAGAVVYATKGFNFFPGRLGYHEIWHLFVLAGAFAHYLAVWGVVS